MFSNFNPIIVIIITSLNRYSASENTTIPFIDRVEPQTFFWGRVVEGGLERGFMTYLLSTLQNKERNKNNS